MSEEMVQPGYRVPKETQAIVTEYARQLTAKLGFPVSKNRALDLLVKRGNESFESEDERG